MCASVTDELCLKSRGNTFYSVILRAWADKSLEIVLHNISGSFILGFLPLQICLMSHAIIYSICIKFEEHFALYPGFSLYLHHLNTLTLQNVKNKNNDIITYVYNHGYAFCKQNTTADTGYLCLSSYSEYSYVKPDWNLKWVSLKNGSFLATELF